MDNENQTPTPNEHEDPATPITGPLVLSQMHHHAARPIRFPRVAAVWEGDDHDPLRGEISCLLDGLDDEDALPPPPPTTPADDPATPVAPDEEPERPDDTLTAAFPLMPQTLQPEQRRGRPGFLVGLLLLAVVGLLLSAYVVLFPQIVPQATVTLTPTSATLSTSLVVTARTDGSVPDPARHEVAAHLLSITSPVRSASGPTSGTGSQPARAASGTLTFYNAAPYAQTLAEDTAITGVDGMAIVTDRAVVLPAGNPPTFGIASVSAHARMAGPQGNIASLDLNGLCCRSGVSVKNTSAFTGGQAARTFPVASAQDISGLAAPLIASLAQTAQSQVQAEVRPTEQLVSLVACTPQVTPDHPIGNEAARVSVSVAVTCQGETYDQGAVTQLAQARLDQQAAALGAGYALVGNISTSVTQQVTTGTTHATTGILVLLVSAQGT